MQQQEHIVLFGYRHYVKCTCINPSLYIKHGIDAVTHMFPVFSVCAVNDLDQHSFVSKFVSCNCCGTVHHVYDFCKSHIISDDANVTVITINDIRHAIASGITDVLDAHGCDVSIWEETLFKINAFKHMISANDHGDVVRDRVLLHRSNVNGVFQCRWLIIASDGTHVVEDAVISDVET